MGFLMTIPTYPTNPAELIMQKVVENGFERLTSANVDLPLSGALVDDDQPITGDRTADWARGVSAAAADTDALGDGVLPGRLAGTVQFPMRR